MSHYTRSQKKAKQTGSPPHTSQSSKQNHTPALSPDQNMAGKDKAGSKSAFDQILKKLEILDEMKLDMKSIQTDIVEVKNSLSSVKETADEALQKATSSETKISGLENEVSALKNELTDLRKCHDDLKERHLKTEAQERRNNLILDGVAEFNGEKKDDCFQKVIDVLKNEMKLDNIALDRCHRMGPRNKKPRSIIFKVHNFQDREKIWKARDQLKGKKIRISEDYPVEIKKRRDILVPIMRAAVFQKKMATVSYDRLIIDSKVYTCDTLDTLPDCLRPEEAATRRTETHTGFFSKNSPLSNFYKCTFKDDTGTTFSSSEQYYQYNKATFHGDQKTAQDILAEDDPGSCKYLGGQVHIVDQKVWEENCVKIMQDGCMHKFSQNASLRDFLISTQDTVIIEANPKDDWWSVGLSLTNENLFNPTAWKGKNNLGKVLRRIRDHFNQETSN